MSFNTIPSALIEVSEPTRKEIFQLTKDNFDDHESRISSVEAINKRVIVFNEVVANPVHFFNTQANNAVITVYRAQDSFSFTTAQITNFNDGTSGTLEVDVLKGTSLASLSSVFSTKPSVTFGAGSNASSTNAVFSTTNVSANDWIMIRITSVMAGQTANTNFHFVLSGEA